MYDVQDFQKDVIERSKETPVLVDFWAAWCAPCLMLGPVLEQAADEANSAWVLAKVDTERFPQDAMNYGVRSIPNVKLFINGEVVDEFIGAIPKPAVVDFMSKALAANA